MTGIPKSLVTTASAAVPTGNAGTTPYETIWITGVSNANAATVVVSEEDVDGSGDPDGSAGTALAKIKTGVSFTPVSPIPLRQGRRMHLDKADVTVAYVIEGGEAITGPTGQTFTSTSY